MILNDWSHAGSKLHLLEQEVVPEINESYLFHGTKTDTVRSILYDGIDNRLGGDHLLFGRGAYFAETTTKADQYAGTRQHCNIKASVMLLIAV